MHKTHRDGNTSELSAAVDWQAWLRRWDIQQTGYLPHREARFTAILDVLESLLPKDFLALDLACGPGAISQRLLTRFPNAHCIALDFDPVLLAMGQGTLGAMGGRLRWVEADLMQETWLKQLDGQQVHAVLSTTALHWLPTEHLTRVYRQLGQLVRPGGVVLNGDHLKFAPAMAIFQDVADTVKARNHEEAFVHQGIEDWAQWWEAVAAEPAFQELLAERKRRFAWQAAGCHVPIYDLHEAALRDAGFRQVGVIWQYMDNRVLMAIR